MPAAKGKGKARSWLTKNQHGLQEKETLHHRPRGRKRTNILHRVESRNTSDVNNLIYGFLGNLAVLNKNQRHSKTKRFKVPGMRIKRQRHSGKNNKTNNRKKISRLSFAPSESTSRSTDDSVSVSGAMESSTSRASSVYNCNDSTTNDSDPPEPLDSKQGVKELLKRKSLIEMVNNYIKNGIKADMQKAKRYMKKALSFGVDTGYLKPLDNSGHLLEVSSELPGIKFSGKRDTVTERKRRKNMRRGIVNFDDCDTKSAKKRATKKETEQRQKETTTNVSKKRDRSNSSANESTSKIVNKRNVKKAPPKKKAKIARQSRPAIRSSKRMRRRRSPTPWRSSNLREKDDESPTEHGGNNQEKSNDNKNDNESNNSTTDANENRKSATRLFRKDDSKNHHQDSSAHGSIDNFPPESQQSIESTQEGDKQ